MILALIVIAVGALASAPGASAESLGSRGATLPLCQNLLNFDVLWPQVNLDFPGQPFFNDGNNDGIADLLQLGHAKLGDLASDLEGLASYATSSDLRNDLVAMATDVKGLANEPAPTTAAQSSQDVADVEKVASKVQQNLKASGCGSEVAAANNAADNAAAGQSATLSSSSKVAAAIVLFLILNVPLIRRIWRHRRRPRLRLDGSAFTGNLRRWRVETITGQVLSTDPRSVISGSGHLANSGSVQISTTLYEIIRLRLADGREKNVEVVDIMASPNRGDVLTVCVGQKRSRSVTFAVLNHTTGQQKLNAQKLFSLREGSSVRQVIFLMSLIFGSLISMVVALFGGAPWLILAWIALMVVFGVEATRAPDMQPLWNRGRAEYALLRI